MRTLERLSAWIARARDLGVVAIDAETTSIDPMQAELCGFSLAVGAERGLLRAAWSTARAATATACFRGDLVPDQIAESAALAALKPLLEDRGVLKVGHNLKFDWLVLARAASRSRPTTTPC